MAAEGSPGHRPSGREWRLWRPSRGRWRCSQGTPQGAGRSPGVRPCADRSSQSASVVHRLWAGELTGAGPTPHDTAGTTAIVIAVFETRYPTLSDPQLLSHLLRHESGAPPGISHLLGEQLASPLLLPGALSLRVIRDERSEELQNIGSLLLITRRAVKAATTQPLFPHTAMPS